MKIENNTEVFCCKSSLGSLLSWMMETMHQWSSREQDRPFTPSLDFSMSQVNTFSQCQDCIMSSSSEESDSAREEAKRKQPLEHCMGRNVIRVIFWIRAQWRKCRSK